MPFNPDQHWKQVYQDKASDQVSWFQTEATASLALIKQSHLSKQDPIIDVGGGASVLVDGLLAQGYQHVTVVDLAEAALAQSKQRLAEQANNVDWRVGNILSLDLPAQHYQLWHDRAVFHFLTEPEQRARYVQQLKRAVKPGGYVLMATFAEDGPERCSGLPVQRYSIEALSQVFAAPYFHLLHSSKETHMTPAGREQQFIFALFRKI